ncbi:aldehyde dehydrogenase family protein [Streptococcus gallolyticus]|uniref:aldehyde dehydrogenase family protein n=1 Tax=Streptococcus hepaticus TaxID=3349163 RepID=UPI001C9497AF|nr:aldehyde dehydrogenase family protein [Streptococcus gallolyticus]MBY5041815.1 aldehyde dehydrogenase family protein [Streptococcus gallolyticus]
MLYIDKDLASIQEIRNLLLNAQTTFAQLQKLTQADLDQYSATLIQNLQKDGASSIREFVAQNQYGQEEDEIFLCQEFLKRFDQTLQRESYTGIIGGSSQEKVIEIGVPLGVIGVLLPAYPTYTLIVNLLLLAIKSGNAMVLVAHKLTKPATIHAIGQLLDQLDEMGYPAGALSLAEIANDAGISELLLSDKLSLLINIGCPEYITTDFRTNTPLIYGGESSGPVFIERTADLEKAVKDVIHSRSFDNGILPGSEQFLVTENIIADQITHIMAANGGYILTQDDTEKLITFLKASEKNVTNSYNGKSAAWLAKMAGFSVPKDTQVLISVQEYMNDEDYFNKKLLCPIIILYREPDWTLACVKCMSILSELKMGHTLTIHSADWKIIKEFAMVKAVGRIVVNAPTACTATGIKSSFAPSLILGGITTGRGYRSENITPRHLTYTRQVGFE